MDLDWAVAVSVFLVFVAIGMAYYWGLFETNANPAQGSLGPINQKILGFLMVDSWNVPVKYTSAGPGTSIIYLDFSWPAETRDSSRILASGSELPCMLQGNRLYFQADVEGGDNYFDLKFANVSGPLQCNSVLETFNANISIPLASEKSRMISQARIGQMLATDYSHFRQSMGIIRNFRVEVDSGATSAYGPQPPQYTNTYVEWSDYLVQETGSPITIRVMVW